MAIYIRPVQRENKTYWYIVDDTVMRYLRKDWQWHKECNNRSPAVGDPDRMDTSGFYDSQEEAEEHLRAKLNRSDKFRWSVER